MAERLILGTRADTPLTPGRSRVGLCHRGDGDQDMRDMRRNCDDAAQP